jgi:hypothetical protein
MGMVPGRLGRRAGSLLHASIIAPKPRARLSGQTLILPAQLQGEIGGLPDYLVAAAAAR